MYNERIRTANVDVSGERSPIVKTKLLFAVSLLALTLATLRAQSSDPRFTSDGQLIRPDNYREWVYLSSGLGMTYRVVQNIVNAAIGERFDNVFVTPQAYKAFLQTGRWPDKTMFILEVRSAATKGSINRGGHYQEDVVGLEAHVKDEARFPNKWAFFQLGTSAQAAKPLATNSDCQTCHAKSGAVDDTFVQFYPTLLPVAKAKGTLKPTDDK
jgi:Cytochrome P460